MSCAVVVLPDGAKMAYNVLGSEHSYAEPIVLIGGMSSIMGDWERLSTALAKNRPVLIFDHRGMGESTYANEDRDDHITVESMARDLLILLQSLGWKELAICGFSMGGVIAQQLLLLPYHSSQPALLPFRVTHVLLAGTVASPIRDHRYGLHFGERPYGPLNDEQKKELARPVMESTFDPVWLRNNDQRRQWWLARMVSGRPSRTIMKQAATLAQINFRSLHTKFPRNIQVLTIHGELDEVVPFSSMREILHLLPHARSVEIGDRPGQIPDYQFGHHWWEYFDIQIWQDVVNKFLDNDGCKVKSHL